MENLAHLSAIDARIDYRRSFRHVIADLLDEFLNWDSKFFATIGLLLVRPWKLTNQFLAKTRKIRADSDNKRLAPCTKMALTQSRKVK